MQFVYDELAKIFGKASDCVDCREYENNRSQKLEIADYLPKVRKAFEV